MTEESISPDLVAILRDRPERISQAFPDSGKLTLLCPPHSTPKDYEALQIAFGPFSGSVLIGAYAVGLLSRMDELQDLWEVVLAEAFPTEDDRKPGGTPRATVRTAALGWRLLAALGSAIETLASTAEAVDDWRTKGQPIGGRCSMGESLLGFSTSGAESVASSLLRFADADDAGSLLGYPSERIMRRHVSRKDSTLLARRCARSAELVAEAFRVAAGVVGDPFWRTFMKWKHGTAVTSPGAAPLWLPQTSDLNVERTQSRLNTGIVVFDTRPEPTVYVWPAERTDLVLYSAFASRALDIARLLLGSVLAYAHIGVDSLQWFEVDDQHQLDPAEITALQRLSSSAFPIAALAGQWR